MGSVFSKSASKITPPRKYPLRPPPPPHHPARPNAKPAQLDPTNPSSPNASDYTAPTPEPFDPQYAASLRRLGSAQPVDPFGTGTTTTTTLPPHHHNHHHHPPSSSSSKTISNPSRTHVQQTTFPTTSSSSSPLTANPAVQILTRRRAIQRAAEAEFAGTLEAQGEEYQRSFLDVVTLRRVLVLRDRGVSERQIEREMGLREGLVGRLGRREVVRPAGVVGLVE